MQTNTDIVNIYFRAVDQGDLEKAGRYLADDFQWFGPVDGPMGKQETLEVMDRLQRAMPNYKHALSHPTEVGPVVKVTVQAGGRHTQPLDLARLGMGIPEGVAAGSGRMIIFEPEDLEFTVKNGKIATERKVTSPRHDLGVPGFLQALGFTG